MNSRSASKINFLRDSRVPLSYLGVGGAPFGGSGSAGQKGPELTEVDVSQVVELAIGELGLRYFDTAPHYGWGKSEKMLSAVLPGLDRKSFTLSTKVGVKLVPYRGGPPLEVNSFNSSEPWRSSFDFSRESVKCTLEGSLERLKLNRVDIVYIHDPDEGVTLLTPSADPRSKSHYSKVMGETLPYLHELKRQKIISAIGVGINQHEMLCDFAKEGQGIFDVFLLAHRITLLDHLGFVRELLPLCQEKGISLVAGSVSHRGILLTGSRPKDGSQPYFNLGSASPEIISKVEGIEVVCKEYGVPLMSAALQFPTLFKPVDSVLVGVKDTRELMEDVEYFERRLPTDFWRELKHKELIASEIDIAE